MTPVEVTMPRLSDSMEEGTVSRWLVDLGEAVAEGQPLVEIDTDKATVVYEAETSGTLLEIVVPEGESAALGVAIARIGAPGDALPSARARSEQAVEPAATPGAASEPRAGVRIEPLTRLQQTIARRMVEGASAPTFSLEADVDMSAAGALRRSLRGGEGAVPSLNDLVVKAVALALRDFPRLNGSYTDAGFELHEHVNVGIAVATGDGLIVPVVRDVDRKGLSEIARETRELAARVRNGSIGPAELEGGTFTVTNLGMFGVRSFVAILNPPQAGILAVGAAAKRPVVDETGAVAVRELATTTIVCDHRIVYGAEAARFLARVRGLLELPTQLTQLTQ